MDSADTRGSPKTRNSLQIWTGRFGLLGIKDGTAYQAKERGRMRPWLTGKHLERPDLDRLHRM